MQVDTIQVNHPGLGEIIIHSELPEQVASLIGQRLDSKSDIRKFYYASSIIKNNNDAFEIRDLMVIEPKNVKVGPHMQGTVLSNYIIVVMNNSVADLMEAYPSGIMSVIYKTEPKTTK